MSASPASAATASPGSPSLQDFPFRCDIAPGYADLDNQVVVNNVAVHALHQEAAVRFQRSLFGDACWRPVDGLLHPARVATQFTRVTGYGATVRCGVQLLAADASGCTIGSALFQHGECLGTQEHRLAAWRDGAAVPLAAAQQAALQAQLAQWPAAAGAAPAAAADWDVALQPEDADMLLTTRYGDVDATGCVGTLPMMRYVEQARVSFLFAAAQRAGVDFDRGPVDCLLVSSRIRFERREGVPETLRLARRLGRLGTSSITLQAAVFDGARRLALNEAALVCIGRDSGRPTAVPDALRLALQGA